MRVLMLGWEYPPHISGGLGTACAGLTTALARNGLDIVFIVPQVFGAERAEHMQLVSAAASAASPGEGAAPTPPSVPSIGVPSALRPYARPEDYEALLRSVQRAGFGGAAGELLGEILAHADQTTSSAAPYGSDMFAEVSRYAERVAVRAAEERFDLIHAHDWMTFPAALLMKAARGCPLVVHVHSLEHDRSGAGADPRIEAIERLGLQGADLVIAVSFYTRTLIHQIHGIPLEKIHVVHNGVYPAKVTQPYRLARGWSGKIVLFLGRITFQKGPEYFVEAAAKVIPLVPDALFVMAGTGDMLPRMVERVKQLGLSEHFYFPGFLRGQEVEQIFSLADVYVMPSVSEPFGIAALEAISFETPVIISRQSGVAEVLTHALKVDFWDTHRLADLLVNALRYPELRADMVALAREELRELRWGAAALKTIDLYRMIV